MLGKVLSGQGHGQLAVAVGEPRPQGVFKGDGSPQRGAEADVADGIGRLGHVVAAPGQGDLGRSGEDILYKQIIEFQVICGVVLGYCR